MKSLKTMFAATVAVLLMTACAERTDPDPPGNDADDIQVPRPSAHDFSQEVRAYGNRLAVPQEARLALAAYLKEVDAQGLWQPVGGDGQTYGEYEDLDLDVVDPTAAAVDLDGDGRDEVVAYLNTDKFCDDHLDEHQSDYDTPLGCRAVVIAQIDGRYRVVSELRGVALPIMAGVGYKGEGWRPLVYRSPNKVLNDTTASNIIAVENTFDPFAGLEMATYSGNSYVASDKKPLQFLTAVDTLLYAYTADDRGRDREGIDAELPDVGYGDEDETGF